MRFLKLSRFFFHSVTMLVYVVIEIFILLWLILSYRMQGSMQETLRMAAMYFASSLPWVVLLFIFFPRISFEHDSYGFRSDEIRRMGHDGTMYLDSKALLVPSDRIVMEVGFEKRIPPSGQLYFRGSLLYFDKKDHWEPLSKVPARMERSDYESIDELIIYKITLYPTRKRWLYLLDLPFEAPEEAVIDADFVTTLKKSIEETQHYEATALRPLLKVLQKEGYVREEGETMHAFFYRYLDQYPQSVELEMTDTLYEQIRYGGDSSKESEVMLRETIRAFLTKR